MAENLNYADSVNYPSMLGRNWCWPNDKDSCDLFGRAYEWSAVIDSIHWAKQGVNCGYDEEACQLPSMVQGICPDGWHVPNNQEFIVLMNAAGGRELAGGHLKSTSGWDGKRGNGTDDFGFTVLPFSGYHADHSYGVGGGASFWSSSDETYVYAWKMSFSDAHTVALVDYAREKKHFSSVRCVKDEDNP